MEKEEWETWFDLWYAKTWGDGSNWIGAESSLVREAYLEALRAAGADEFATLSTVLSQIEAGDRDGAMKMLLARMRKINPPMGADPAQESWMNFAVTRKSTGVTAHGTTENIGGKVFFVVEHFGEDGRLEWKQMTRGDLVRG